MSPLTKDVGKNIKELKASGKKRSKKQILAISLSGAREKGANIPMPKHKSKMERIKERMKYD